MIVKPETLIGLASQGCPPIGLRVIAFWVLPESGNENPYQGVPGVTPGMVTRTKRGL
jgi:hypothetical protein